MFYSGKKRQATHVIWKLVTGEYPSQVIDHINGVRVDNRWDNLRQVTQAENLLNKHVAQKNNKLGIQGVTLVKGKYYWARVKIGAKQKSLGFFSTAEAAHTAYKAAKNAHNPAVYPV